ncbi:MAG: hydroxymethylglutaryl-CoA lyase [Sphingomicrobium sp.]
MSPSTSIELVEVGPRDGLQNEPMTISTGDKVELIARSVAAGVRRIEVASFVSPRRVPQMADAEQVAAALPADDGVIYIGLVLNERGAVRALGTKLQELGAVCVTTDRFAGRNQGQTSDESIAVASRIVAMAKAAGRRGQITISGAFGCPFEGEVDPDRTLSMAVQVAEAGSVEVALADTIGVASPRDVEALVKRVAAAISPVPVRVHFHNTRNTGLANVWTAVQAGARIVDASLGGLGGCPYAPNATGNVPTEDVVYMLERSGVRTGLDLDRLIETTAWLSGKVGKALPGMVSRAGGFPRAQSERTT